MRFYFLFLFTSVAVAFSVRFSSDNGVTGLPMSTHSILQFNHVITNVGNGYFPQTGIFTAPYAGVYCFSISFMSVNGKGHIFVAIDRHGTMLDYAYANGHDDGDQGSAEVTVHLARGEQVWVRQQGGTAVRGGLFTVFTGYLVQAD